MKKYKRTLNLPNLLKKKSHFLFGARSTGKSTLIRDQLPDARVYDLLSAQNYRRLLRKPEILREELEGYDGLVVIDEVQKLPIILDEVHWIIENRKNRFLLTGSSARKIKYGGANLLGGRAWWAHLFPLTSEEISDFNLLQYLNRGGLPHIYQSDDYQLEIENYVDLYIREEVKAEALTRQIENFVEFLDIVALSNGNEINMTSFASDCGLSSTAVKSYLSILEDTQIGFFVKAFTKTQKRKAITRSKFYLFDLGVTNFLSRRGPIKRGSELFGKAFEHFIALELRAAILYKKLPYDLQYWRSTSQMEVDFVLSDFAAIEVKSSSQLQDKHLKGLRALKEENLNFKKYIVVSLVPHRRVTEDGIEILNINEFLQRLWSENL